MKTGKAETMSEDGKTKKHRAEVPFGFTLIELLVVIAIIGLLISLTSPSLSRALAASKSVGCKNNLRQMGMVLRLHLGDNNQDFLLNDACWPHEWVGWGAQAMPPKQLESYILEGTKVTWKHGDLNKPATIATCPTIATLAPLYYTISLAYCYNQFAATKWYGLGVTPGLPDVSGMADVQAPSAMLAFSDGRFSSIRPAGYTLTTTKAGPSVISEIGLRELNGMVTPYCHNDTANMCFMDGHVEPLRLSDYHDRTESTEGYNLFWYGQRFR